MVNLFQISHAAMCRPVDQWGFTQLENCVANQARKAYRSVPKGPCTWGTAVWGTQNYYPAIQTNQHSDKSYWSVWFHTPTAIFIFIQIVLISYMVGGPPQNISIDVWIWHPTHLNNMNWFSFQSKVDTMPMLILTLINTPSETTGCTLFSILLLKTMLPR